MSDRTVLHVDVELSEAMRDRLGRALAGLGDLEPILGYIAAAGAREALDQAAGTAAFSSITDLRSYRIFRLVDAGMPVDQARAVVASIFQVTPTAAARYVETALARYRVELEDRVNAVLRALLGQAQRQGDEYLVIIPPTLVTRVKDIAQRANAPAPVFTGDRDAWRVRPQTFEALRQAVAGGAPP